MNAIQFSSFIDEKNEVQKKGSCLPTVTEGHFKFNFPLLRLILYRESPVLPVMMI